MKTIYRIRRKTPLLMNESDGNLTVRAVHFVKVKHGSRGRWTDEAIRFENSEQREAWIGEQIEAGHKFEGKYPLEPFISVEA
jgi:hypothetical protein